MSRSATGADPVHHAAESARNVAIGDCRVARTLQSSTPAPGSMVRAVLPSGRPGGKIRGGWSDAEGVDQQAVRQHRKRGPGAGADG